MSAKEQIHKSIVENLKKTEDWFATQVESHSIPVYSSYDIRDSCYKTGVVDANIYPAGFNNICDIDKESAPEIMKAYLKSLYGSEIKEQVIGLITEEHTNNSFYWENVKALKDILEMSGHRVKIGFAKDFDEPITVQSSTGHEMTVYSAKRVGEGVEIDGEKIHLLISNNDFTDAHEDWGRGLSVKMNPPRELGWYRRKKNSFFEHYNQLCREFSEVIGIDPWLIQVETQAFKNFDLSDESSKSDLASKVENVLQNMRAKYKEHGVDREPYVVVKNNSGTYGLAVMQVSSAEDVFKLNNRARTKMKAAKGGGGVSEVILQEGIESRVTSEEKTSEPAIYMIGAELAGGFLRTHGKKGPRESLNSPGAVYQRLCVSDLKINVKGHPLENTYGWLAKLSALAIGREAKEMGVEF